MSSSEFLVQSFIAFLGYLAFLSILGCTVFNAWARWRGQASITLGFVPAIILTISACLVASADFLVLSYQLTGEWEMVFEPMMLSMLWQGEAGAAWVLSCFGAICFACAEWVKTRQNRSELLSKLNFPLNIIVLIGLPLAFVQSGHVSPAMVGWPVSFFLVAHLYLISFWFVSVIFFLRESSNPSNKQLHAIADRFGVDAQFWLPLLLLSGGVMAFQLISSLNSLMESLYGQLVLLKVVLVLSVLLCGLVNKLVMVPRLAIDSSSASCSFRRVLRIELSLLLIVLLVTSFLTSGVSVPMQG